MWLSALVAAFLIGPATPTAMAAITEFPLPTAGAAPAGITAGPDGNLWMAESEASRIARITPAGVVTEFVLPPGREPFDLAIAGGLVYFTERAGDRIGRLDPAAPNIQASIAEFVVPGAGSAPTGIAAGADGALWFTQSGGDQIGRMTTAGAVTEFAVPGIGSVPTGIAAGPDGALWFTQRDSSEVGRITTAGAITEFAVPGLTSRPNDLGAITVGPDGALWFAVSGLDQIGRITTAGDQTRFSIADGAVIDDLVAGSDGALWFTQGGAGKIGRMTTAGTVSHYTLSDKAAGPSGITSGPDGALWFTERFASKVGTISTDTAPDAAVVGPPGPPGEPGPPGTNAGLSLVAFEVKPRRPRVGRRLKVRFAITGGAEVSLGVARVRKGRLSPRETVATQSAATAGVGKLTWNGKLAGKHAKPGRYQLTVAAQRDGDAVESSLRTRLRRR